MAEAKQRVGWTKKKDKCASSWKQRTQQPDLKFVTKNHTQFGHLKNWGKRHLSFLRSIIFKIQPDMISIGILSEFVKLRVVKFINKKAQVHQVLVNYKTTTFCHNLCGVFLDKYQFSQSLTGDWSASAPAPAHRSPCCAQLGWFGWLIGLAARRSPCCGLVGLAVGQSGQLGQLSLSGQSGQLGWFN